MKIRVLICVCMLPALLWGQNRKPQAAWYVDGAKEKFENRSHTAIEAFEQGQSVIYATNAVDLYLTNLRVNKTSGGLNADDRRETGFNSALLADGASKVRLDKCDVISHSAQADGITASGQDTRIIIADGAVSTSRQFSVGIAAINNAVVTVNKTEVNTIDHQSPSYYAHNGGEITAVEAIGLNTGQASPAFYVAGGKISAVKCRLSSAKWTIGSVDSGLLEVIGGELKAGGVCGFLVYGSNDKVQETRALDKLVLTKNKITVAEGPLVLVTNAGGEVSLTKNKISCKDDVIIAVKADEWGPKGANMGNAIIDLDNQSLSGDIYVDSISSLELNLNKGGKLNGKITGNPCEGRTVNVNLKKGGSWSIKGEVYVNRVTFEQPLKKGLKQLKGKHVIYYDANDPYNEPLGGKEHKTAGGYLRPMK